MELWAASLWEVKARRRRLFMQDRVAVSAGASGPWRQQAILGRGRWDTDALRDIVRGYVVAHRADEDAVPVIDEAGFLEQGKASCGVARQHTGSGL